MLLQIYALCSPDTQNGLCFSVCTKCVQVSYKPLHWSGMLIIDRSPDTYPNRISGKTQCNLRLTPLERSLWQLVPVISRANSTTARTTRHRTVFVHINGGVWIAATTGFNDYRLTNSIVTASVSACPNHPNTNPRDSSKQENQDGQHSNHSVESSSVRCVYPPGCIATRSRELIVLLKYSSIRVPITPFTILLRQPTSQFHRIIRENQESALYFLWCPICNLANWVASWDRVSNGCSRVN